MSTSEKSLEELLRAALPASGKDIAESANLEYRTLVNYRSGHRTPPPEVVRRIADAIDAEAKRLRQVATHLRRAVRYQR